MRVCVCACACACAFACACGMCPRVAEERCRGHQAALGITSRKHPDKSGEGLGFAVFFFKYLDFTLFSSDLCEVSPLMCGDVFCVKFARGPGNEIFPSLPRVTCMKSSIA